MNIYLAASIFGAEGNSDQVKLLLNHLKRYGKVLSEHLYTSEYKEKEKLSMVEIHDRDLKWVNEADIIVAECSVPSLGVGYELREAVLKNKKILVLYKKQEKRVSAMIAGLPKVSLIEYYDFNDMISKVDKFFTG